jgi:hypothetical protein
VIGHWIVLLVSRFMFRIDLRLRVLVDRLRYVGLVLACVENV